MKKLNVWLSLHEDQNILAGEMVVAGPDDRGALQGQYRYTQEYLDWENAFALDPIHLPLTRKIFTADRPRSGIHGVFEDSLPDDWGRGILIKKHKLHRKDQRPPQLLSLLQGDAMGALNYSETDYPPKSREILGSRNLVELQRLAAMFEKDPSFVDEGIAILLQAGSSPGGARPKALVQDNGKAYIAKFKSIKDRFAVVSLEAAVMELAQKARVNPAPVRCLNFGTDKVLLVERFDMDMQTKERKHVVTMQTLLGADGYYNLGYRDMADIIRQVSSQPAGDLKKLFRQLVFNALIGNTDDHLKNFSMVCDGKSWLLSPAYDLVPNIGQNHEHVLSINFRNQIPGRDDLLSEAKSFGMKQRKKVNEIIDSIISVVHNWEKLFKEFEVPQEDIDIIGRDIEIRLAKIKNR